MTSRLHQGFYRNGNEHRAGADVSFGDIIKCFGFRSIEVGKWVTKEEQQIGANLFFDALYDLCDILHVPESVISLNGRLALAFGKGGRKGVCAHYTPAKHELSLAKNAGAGSLAHEWFHAFDHYIADKMYADSQPGQFASELCLRGKSVIPHNLNKRLEESLHHILLAEVGADTATLNPFITQAVALDQQAKTVYYTLPQEACARAFEAMIQDHPIKNSFLVQGTKQSKLALLGAYPTGTLRTTINAALHTYFYQLGCAVKQKI